jgi:hypothetical protein
MDPSKARKMLAEPLAVILSVIEAFEKLNIPYLIGGSLASALHGMARSTLDADLVWATALQAELSWLEGTQYEENKFVLSAFMGQIKRPGETQKPAKKSKTRQK